MQKNLLVVSLTLLFGSCLGVGSIYAQTNELVLEVTKKCDIQYTGDSCIANLKITNNAGKALGGEAFLHIDYKGMCSGNKLINFDGEGIDAKFSVASNNWLNFSGWENGTTAVSGFNISEGETISNLKINTVPNLCPGEYIFTLGLRGGEYATSPVGVGGGGGIDPTLNLTIPSPTTLSAGAQKVDANKDGKIDKYDFALLMANWGKTGINVCDFNGDGKVDKYDLALLMLYWSL